MVYSDKLFKRVFVPRCQKENKKHLNVIFVFVVGFCLLYVKKFINLKEHLSCDVDNITENNYRHFFDIPLQFLLK